MDANDQSWFWTPEWQAKEAEAEESFRLGHYKTFETMDELIEALEPSATLKASMDELESGKGQRFATWQDALAWLEDDDIELDSPNWLGESLEELKQRGFERINDPRLKVIG